MEAIHFPCRSLLLSTVLSTTILNDNNDNNNNNNFVKNSKQRILSTVRGKILAGENFGEFGERLAIRQNFPHQYL